MTRCLLVEKMHDIDRLMCAYRPFNGAYYCQAPQSPTYNFSDPTVGGTTTAAGGSTTNNNNNNGRRLLQQTGCNHIPYYGTCGEKPSRNSNSNSNLYLLPCTVQDWESPPSSRLILHPLPCTAHGSIPLKNLSSWLLSVCTCLSSSPCENSLVNILQRI